MCVPICPAFRSRGGGRWRRHASAWRMPRAGPGRAALNREHPGSRGWLGHGRRPRRKSAQHGLRLTVGRRVKKPEVPGQVHTCHLDTAVCWRARDPTSGDPPSHPLPGMNGLADRQAERAFLAGTVSGAPFTRVPDASQLPTGSCAGVHSSSARPGGSETAVSGPVASITCPRRASSGRQRMRKVNCQRTDTVLFTPHRGGG